MMPTTQPTTRLRALILAAFVTAGWQALPAQAQDQSAPAAQPPATEQTTASVPDAKLDQVAAALKEIIVLKQQYQQEIAAAAPTDQPRMLEEANGALTKAVTDKGLSVDEYDAIIKVAQDDPTTRDKLLDKVRTMVR